MGLLNKLYATTRIDEEPRSGVLRKQKSITRLHPPFYNRVDQVKLSGGIRLEDEEKGIWKFTIASASEKGKKYHATMYMSNLPELIATHVQNSGLWNKDKTKIDLNKLARKIMPEMDWKFDHPDCKAYQFWGGKYINTQRGNAKDDEENRPPRVRNPKQYGSLCKHLQNLMDQLPFYTSTLASHMRRYFEAEIQEAENQARKTNRLLGGSGKRSAVKTEVEPEDTIITPPEAVIHQAGRDVRGEPDIEPEEGEHEESGSTGRTMGRRGRPVQGDTEEETTEEDEDEDTEEEEEDEETNEAVVNEAPWMDVEDSPIYVKPEKMSDRTDAIRRLKNALRVMSPKLRKKMLDSMFSGESDLLKTYGISKSDLEDFMSESFLKYIVKNLHENISARRVNVESVILSIQKELSEHFRGLAIRYRGKIICEMYGNNGCFGHNDLIRINGLVRMNDIIERGYVTNDGEFISNSDVPSFVRNRNKNGYSKVFEKHNSDGTYDYSSVQAEFDKDSVNAILEFGKDLINDEDVIEEADGEILGREETPHVTVKYGLHTDDFEEVDSVFDGEEPFEITLGDTGIFENDDKPYDVVFIEVESQDLHRLNSKIKEKLKCTDTHPVYVPHLTLSYVKSGTGKKYNGANDLNGFKILISNLIFSSKEKKKYKISLEKSIAQV